MPGVRLFFLILIGFLSTSHLDAQEPESRSVTVLFDVDRTEISQEYKNLLRSTILDIGFGNIREIHIEGHTDSDHSDEYNLDLSKRRAQETRQFLLSQGVKEHLIFTSAFGESSPFSDDKSENRRSVVRFVFSDMESVPLHPVWLKLHVTDAHTGKAIQADYTFEFFSKLKSGQTDRKGIAFLPFQPGRGGQFLIASSRGYLNERADLSAAERSSSYDTVDIFVQLHRVQVVKKLSFRNIYFHTDSDSLKPESKPELEKLLATLKFYPDMYIEIQGHMNYPSSRGMPPYQQIFNYNLSYKRARRIYTYLIDNGIARERLTYKGLSNSRMVYPDPKSRAEEDANKRVEIWTLRKLPAPGSKSP
ncbi:MAG: OmpA family protein [Flavobacteriales bacterium]|nr:OmpA family protein [Flavobacteriales bacterium]